MQGYPLISHCAFQAANLKIALAKATTTLTVVDNYGLLSGFQSIFAIQYQLHHGYVCHQLLHRAGIKIAILD